jgi:hypothetical protein
MGNAMLPCPLIAIWLFGREMAGAIEINGIDGRIHETT